MERQTIEQERPRSGDTIIVRNRLDRTPVVGIT